MLTFSHDISSAIFESCFRLPLVPTFWFFLLACTFRASRGFVPSFSDLRSSVYLFSGESVATRARILFGKVYLYVDWGESSNYEKISGLNPNVDTQHDSGIMSVLLPNIVRQTRHQFFSVWVSPTTLINVFPIHDIISTQTFCIFNKSFNLQWKPFCISLHISRTRP